MDKRVHGFVIVFNEDGVPTIRETDVEKSMMPGLYLYNNPIGPVLLLIGGLNFFGSRSDAYARANEIINIESGKAVR